MKAELLFDGYTRKDAWAKQIVSFRSKLGQKDSDVIKGGLDIPELIDSLTSMGTMSVMTLVPSHTSASTHLMAALLEQGVDPSSLSKRKVSLLTFILNAIGFKRFDSVMDEVIHEGEFVDFKTAIAADDSTFTNIIFSVLKMLFPQIGMLDSLFNKLFNV